MDADLAKTQNLYNFQIIIITNSSKTMYKHIGKSS